MAVRERSRGGRLGANAPTRPALPEVGTEGTSHIGRIDDAAFPSLDATYASVQASAHVTDVGYGFGKR